MSVSVWALPPLSASISETCPKVTTSSLDATSGRKKLPGHALPSESRRSPRLSCHLPLGAGLGTRNPGTGPCRAHELLAWVVAEGGHGSDRAEAVSAGSQDSVYPPVGASEHEGALV